MKVEKLGTVWTAAAKIQFINGERWETVAVCMDTPNAIRRELDKQRKQRPGITFWVKSDTNGRYIP